MATNSVSTMEKPLQHLGLSDWNARLAQLRNVAEARRADAFAIRHSARTLRNETRIETDWSNYETNEALSDRIAELARWRTAIAKILERIANETRLLREETVSTERELDAMVTPLSTVAECLSLRDCRLGSELTYDDADSELKKELAVIENNQRLLREQCQFAWEKLARLEDVQFKINMEVINKAEAEFLDTTQLDLNKFSANISFKTSATRHPRNSCTYEAWLELTKNMKIMAENELSDTYAIRESLFVSRLKARNILHSQQDRTDHTIRKRVFETQRARNELQWQRLKLKEEMEHAVCEIRTLEQAYRDKTDALKLAETRLENRAQRSGSEQCLDEAYDKLCTEVAKMQHIRRALQDKIDAAKTNYSLLEEQAQKIDGDLENKENALMTDIRNIDVRARLKVGEFASPSASEQTDRNITLTHMEDEVPKN